jgi:hypothetical protein
MDDAALLGLLHGARHRFRSARARVHHHPADGPAVWIDVWLERDRRRVERREPHLAAETVETLVVRDGQWWLGRPGRPTASGLGEPPVSDDPGLVVRRLFDPSWLLASHDLEPAGAASHADRPAIAVTGRRRAPLGGPLPPRAAEADLSAVVDRATGVLLRCEERGSVDEVLQVVFDEAHAPERYELASSAGEEPADAVVDLHDAAEAVGFTLFLPRRLPGPATLRVTRRGSRVRVTYALEQGGTVLLEQQAASSAPFEGPVQLPGGAVLEVEKDGTAVRIESDLAPAEVESLARTLVAVE